jgi:DNA-binding MurR/RpiR family transcriptional regulator
MTTRKMQRAHREEIAAYVLSHQEDTYREMAEYWHCSEPTIGNIARKLLGFRQKSKIKAVKAMAAVMPFEESRSDNP